MVLFPALKSFSDSPLPQRESCDQDLSWPLTLQPQLPQSSLQGSSTLQKYQATSSPLIYHMLSHTAKLNMLFPWLEYLPLPCCIHLSGLNSCLTPVKPFLSSLTTPTSDLLCTDLDNSHTLKLLGYMLMYPTRQDLCLPFVYDNF